MLCLGHDRGIMRARGLCSLLFWTFCVAPVAVRAQGGNRTLPWNVVDRRVLGRELELSGLPAVAVVKGGVFALDLRNNQLLRLDTLGRIVWRAGRSGQGPGEFTQASRVAARPDGGAIVYDAALNALTYFTASGRYLGRKDFPLAFSQLDNFIERQDHSLVVAGVIRFSTPGSTFAERYAVHVFSEDMKWVRSFGPLPEVADSMTLRFWGAGFVSESADRSLRFVRKLPYELYRYSTEGQLLGSTLIDSVRGKPDDFMVHEHVPDPLGRPAVRHRLTGTDVPRPIGVVEVSPELLIGGLVSRSTRRVDAINRAGVRISSGAMADGAATLVGFDPATTSLWGVGFVNDEPVLFREVVRFTNIKGERP